MAPQKKGRSPRPGRVVDTWVGDKPRPSFEGWLRAFKGFYEAGGTGPDEPGDIDPATAYCFERLTARDCVRFSDYLRELALLGYDLRTIDGTNKFWRLPSGERDRLFYIVQDPERFRTRVREDYFEPFRDHFEDFQERFAEFFRHIQEAEPSLLPDDLTAHYRLFGLDPEASLEDVKEQYRILAFKLHPDHGGDEEKMKALNIAYAALLRAAAFAGLNSA